MSDVGAHLGDNLRQLREAQGLSQAQIAARAEIPRATWTNLESGGANPTLAVLVKAAAALHVRLEELLAPPRAIARHFPADTLAVRQKGLVTVRRLLPDNLEGLEIERMALPAGSHMAGVPHTPGTREYLTCETGRVELAVAGTVYALAPGDVVVFRGDQKHGYRNRGDVAAVAYSVVAFAS